LTWERFVDILFATKRLAKQCASDRIRAKAFGGETAKVLRRRLDQLRAADDLAVMRTLPGRCHELTGDRKGELAVDLRGPYRLVFEPAANHPPTKEDGGLDWSRVTAVRILEVEDYHG
jgi:proteic killer suppression protein